jgi:hypothetical protein
VSPCGYGIDEHKQVVCPREGQWEPTPVNPTAPCIARDGWKALEPGGYQCRGCQTRAGLLLSQLRRAGWTAVPLQTNPRISADMVKDILKEWASEELAGLADAP